LISANLFNPCHPCAIHLLNNELNVQECDATLAQPELPKLATQ
jgi:hypothetical protein